MSDINLKPPPLRLRIPPIDGESWPGYLVRAAGAHAAPPAEIVAPISRTWARRLSRSDRTTNQAGIAMTDRTAIAVARRLNLTAGDVHAMTHATHNGLAVTLTPDDIRAFDPIEGRATVQQLERIGWVTHPHFKRYCPRCTNAEPGLEMLVWRYGWATYCLTHGQALQPGGPAASRGPRAAALIVQAHLEDILRGQREFSRLSVRDGFTELLASVDLLTARRVRTRLKATDVWSTRHIADVLPDALTAIETPMGVWSDKLYEDMTYGKHPAAPLVYRLQKHGATSTHGLRKDLTPFAGQHGHILYAWARDIHIPPAHQRPTTSASRANARTELPKLLPVHLVPPTLTSLTPWLRLEHGRKASAQAAFMLATGTSLKTACDHLGWSGPDQVPLRKLWWYLESIGQLGTYLRELREVSQHNLRAVAP